jgi:quercetin dioxygenase-like cupin family protein
VAQSPELQELGELAEQILASRPGYVTYGGGEGQHLFTEQPQIGNPLWPGGSVQVCRMARGEEFPIHAHHSCSETLEVIGGLLDLTIAGRVVRLVPGDTYRLLPGEAHAATAVTDCVVVGITVPRESGYPAREGVYGPDGIEPGPAA